ncbi:MAG TPA: type II toxin-antitoxin system ParD family antitoxin [Allosphingosinicella sp.]|nr:type II toxin-antitoxin system ParD family antitoxin [Allosphingosinicella sp.]
MDDQPTLDPQDEAFIAEALRSGRYASRAAIIAEGLPRVREREAAWKRLEAELRRGIDSLEGGKGIPLEEAFAQARSKIREKRNGRKDAA